MTDPRHHVPAPARPALAADAVDSPPYERTRWEAAVLERQLHIRATAVALILSHHAGAGGLLPADGIQRTDCLRKLTRMSVEMARSALRDLERAGLISRPPVVPGVHQPQARPITLTIPVRPEEPPHPGERP